MEDNLLTVTNIFVGASKEQGVVIIRLPFLDAEEVEVSGYQYLLTVERARLLVSLLTKQLRLLEPSQN